MSEITLNRLKEINNDIKYLIGYNICDSFGGAVDCAKKQRLPKEDIKEVSGWYGEFNDLTVRPEPYMEAAMSIITSLEEELKESRDLVQNLLEEIGFLEEQIESYE